MIHAIIDKLEYLAFYQDRKIYYKFNTLNFKKLQYFEGTCMSIKCMNDILKTAVNLRKISICIDP